MVKSLKNCYKQSKNLSSSNKVLFQAWVCTAIAMQTVAYITLQGSKPFQARKAYMFMLTATKVMHGWYQLWLSGNHNSTVRPVGYVSLCISCIFSIFSMELQGAILGTGLKYLSLPPS